MDIVGLNNLFFCLIDVKFGMVEEIVVVERVDLFFFLELVVVDILEFNLICEVFLVVLVIVEVIFKVWVIYEIVLDLVEEIVKVLIFGMVFVLRLGIWGIVIFGFLL